MVSRASVSEAPSPPSLNHSQDMMWTHHEGSDETVHSSSGYRLSTITLDGQKRQVFARTMISKEELSAIIPVPAEMYFDLWLMLIPVAQKYGVHILQPYGHSSKTVYVPWIDVRKPQLTSEQQSALTSLLCQVSVQIAEEYMPLVRQYVFNRGFVPIEYYCFAQGHLQLHVYPELEVRNLTLTPRCRKMMWETDEHYVRRVLAHSIFFDPIYVACTVANNPFSRRA